MKAIVIRELWVEGGAQERAVPQGDRAPCRGSTILGKASEHFHAITDSINDRGTDKHGVEGRRGVSVRGSVTQRWYIDVGLKAVHLPAVGVSLYGDIEGVQGGRVQAFGPLSEDDEASAGAPDGEAVLDGGSQGFVEVEVLHQAAEGGCLTAGQDEAVQVPQSVRRADVAHADIEMAERCLMFDEIALEGQDAYGCHVSPIVPRRGISPRPYPEIDP